MKTKDHVLALLEENRGSSISGAAIAEQLQLSRNAVWKAVKELEKDGYKITAVTNKGYSLDGDNDILSAQGILPHLMPEIAEKIAENNFETILVYDSLESTNKVAKEHALLNLQHGTVVIADSQSAGAGRYGRSFYSPPGSGIYMSIVLDPKQLSFSTPTLITSFIALCVCEAIEAATDKAAEIKWVNDIFLDGKKICGISTEASMDFESGSTQWIVVGIGINVIPPKGGFPKDARNVVGALFEEGIPRASDISRNRLIAQVMNHILSSDAHYSENEMLEKYRQRMFLLGQQVLVTRGEQQFEALAVGIDDSGQLVIQNSDGKREALSSGEISIKPM